MLAVYVIAMIAVCWHFAYGVWLFAAKWGITPGETARRRFAYVCAVLGILLAVMGMASIWAFVGAEVSECARRPCLFLPWLLRHDSGAAFTDCSQLMI